MPGLQLFSDFQNLFRILVVAVLSYLSLVLILRISGNRTLSKMNSFDFVITIALGSAFSAGILQKDVPLSDTLLTLSTLVALQYITTWLSVRFPPVDRLVKSEPRLLFAQGRYLGAALKEAHVTKSEVQAGMRERGFASEERVLFVVLEPNGQIVAVGKEGPPPREPGSTLQSLQREDESLPKTA